jgi:putative nucleotidyltransferase with HDIG domain
MGGRLKMSSEQIEKLEEREIEEKKEPGLLDSGHPLMKKFRESAPGTHKHTQSLVSMVENVCAAIDLSTKHADRLKLAGMYHDIGKMWFPQLYSENQDEDNIHDAINDPWVSYQLITRHVSDTVAIMVAHNFPTEVIRIASQHHGTCILKGMSDKLKRSGTEVNTDDFRYKTERPNCIESLILMLCDQIEASSRSIYVDQKKDVGPDELVSTVYDRLHKDGQFDYVEVYLGKLKKVQEALISDVSSNFQKRVSYPENDGMEEKSE